MATKVTGPVLSQRLLVGCGLGTLVGGPAAYGLAALIGQAWATCDVGVNASANSFVLLIGLPVLWVVNCGVFGAAFAVVPGASWPWRVLGALAGLLALTLLAWMLFAWQGTPANYPSPLCPANVPPWWPSWLPA